MKILHETCKEIVVSFPRDELDLLLSSMYTTPADDRTLQFRRNMIATINDHFAEKPGERQLSPGYDGNGSEVFEYPGATGPEGKRRGVG